jgi:hypothetical protein
MRWSAAQALAWVIQQKPVELREWTNDMGPKIRDAQKKLAALIAAGKIEAWGRKEPHGLFEQIPDDPFRISGVAVVVGVHGDMTTTTPHKPYTGPRWHSIEFEADEIKRECPQPPPPSTNDWMMKEAERLSGRGRKGKREDLVRDCMKATGCSRREALAAYKELPQGLRRPRGKPAKDLG